MTRSSYVGTHAAIPDVPGLKAARPLTHIEALELDYLPQHLIVLGGGYVGLELAQAYRRFGSRVTVVERGPRLMGREDRDIAEEIQRILSGEGIEFLLAAELIEVRGQSGEDGSLIVRADSGERTIRGSDILVAAGRVPNTSSIGLEQADVEVDDSWLYSRQRAAGDERARGMGHRRMRRKPAIHPRIGGRLSDHQG